MRAPRLAFAVAVLLLALAARADAHGPCPTCLSPHRVAPGGQLQIDYPTFRAVLNPTREQLSLGPKPYCYGCQLKLWRDRVPGQPAIVLGTWRPRRDRATVRVPTTMQPGRYLVALFDGSEGGTHYTWTYIDVQTASGDDDNSPALVIVIAALAVAGALATFLLRRRSTARRRSRRR